MYEYEHGAAIYCLHNLLAGELGKCGRDVLFGEVVEGSLCLGATLCLSAMSAGVGGVYGKGGCKTQSDLPLL